MLTASGDLVKLWAVKGHRVLREIRWASQKFSPAPCSSMRCTVLEYGCSNCGCCMHPYCVL